MSADELRAIEIEFMLVIRRALLHQERTHGVSVLAGPVLCPGGAVLIVGRDVLEQLQALQIEGFMIVGGTAAADAVIDRAKKG